MNAYDPLEGVFGPTAPLAPEIQQQDSVFSAEGMRSFGEGFWRENVLTNIYDFYTDNDDEGRIHAALNDYRQIAGMGDTEYEEINPFDDERVLNLGNEYWGVFAEAKTTEEVDVMLSALEGLLEERSAHSNNGISYLLGSMVGLTATPSGVAMMKASKFKDILQVGRLVTAEEVILQNLQSGRTSDQSIDNILWGVGGTAAFVSLQKVIGALSPNVPPNAVKQFADNIEEGVEEYRSAVRPGTDDELPFGRRVDEDTQIDPGENGLNINDPTQRDEFRAFSDRSDATPEVEMSMRQADGERVMKAMGLEKLPDNPVKRSLEGDSDYARGMVPHLVESPLYQVKNAQNGASAVGVDRIIAQKWLGQAMVPAMRKTEQFFRDYRTRVSGSARGTMFRQDLQDRIRGTEGAMTADEFLEAVAIAKRRLDDSSADLTGLPQEAINAAKYWDRVVYRPLAEEAKRLQMFSIRERRRLEALDRKLRAERAATDEGAAARIKDLEDEMVELEAKIADLDNLDINSRFVNRLYNHDELRSQSGKLRWSETLMRNGYTRAQAEAIRQKILGEIPYSNLNADPVGLARSLKERTLGDVPDTELEPFLINNIFALGRYYSLRMGTDVELMRKFGSLDLQPQLKRIEAEFDAKINNAKTIKEKNRLKKSKEQTLEDVETMRDRVRGTYGLPDDPDSWTNRGLRIARMWNATSMLTGALAAVPDIGNIILKEGLQRTFGTTFEALFKNTKGIKLAHQEANLAGEALDMYMSMRAALFADLAESISVRNKFERIAGAGTQAFFNINLMNQWNTAAKTMASLVAGSRMIDDMVVSSRHIRNSGSAKLQWGKPTGRNGQPIKASYNRAQNRVTIDKKGLEEGYRDKIWRNPRTEGVEPIPDKYIQSFSDFKRFIIEHELAHADHTRKAGQSLGEYENSINRIALRRMGVAGTVAKKGPNTVRLRKAGISEEMSARIADQVETYGYFGDNVRIARTHLWEDKEAAEFFRAALGKEINEIIVTPGKGDLPNVIGGGLGHLIPEKAQKAIKDTVDQMPEGAMKEGVKKVGGIFMSEEMSRLIFQFKSFGIAAQHRVMTPALQQMDQNVLIGAVALVGLGALVDQMRREQTGNNYGSFEDKLMSAIERSGLMGYMGDVMRAFENIQNPISNPSALLGTVGGPIVQQVNKAGDVLFDYGRLHVGSKTNQNLVDMAPLSNVAHFRWLNDLSHHSLNALTGVK
ncbi:MAG: hypothetical protein VW498_02010 [Candidatus Thalassarchaeaceae archaeon]